MIDLEGGKQSVDDFLAGSATDGFLVLHRGRIVFERYFNHFAEHTQHLLMSMTKSFTGILAGILVDRGSLDLQQLVTHYLPELEATAYKGATVQQVLNMTSGVNCETPVWSSVWHHQQKNGEPQIRATTRSSLQVPRHRNVGYSLHAAAGFRKVAG